MEGNEIASHLLARPRGTRGGRHREAEAARFRLQQLGHERRLANARGTRQHQLLWRGLAFFASSLSGRRRLIGARLLERAHLGNERFGSRRCALWHNLYMYMHI